MVNALPGGGRYASAGGQPVGPPQRASAVRVEAGQRQSARGANMRRRVWGSPAAPATGPP